MINLEKYKNELVKSGRYFGVNSNNIEKCDNISCSSCIFSEGGCDNERLKWLFEREKITITQKEKVFLDAFVERTEYWIARDKNGTLCLFNEEPLCDDGVWEDQFGQFVPLNINMFTFIKNDKAWPVSELKNLEVSDE